MALWPIDLARASLSAIRITATHNLLKPAISTVNSHGMRHWATDVNTHNSAVRKIVANACGYQAKHIHVACRLLLHIPYLFRASGGLACKMVNFG